VHRPKGEMRLLEHKGDRKQREKPDHGDSKQGSENKNAANNGADKA